MEYILLILLVVWVVWYSNKPRTQVTSEAEKKENHLTNQLTANSIQSYCMANGINIRHARELLRLTNAIKECDNPVMLGLTHTISKEKEKFVIKKVDTEE